MKKNLVTVASGNSVLLILSTAFGNRQDYGSREELCIPCLQMQQQWNTMKALSGVR